MNESTLQPGSTVYCFSHRRPGKVEMLLPDGQVMADFGAGSVVLRREYLRDKPDDEAGPRPKVVIPKAAPVRPVVQTDPKKIQEHWRNALAGRKSAFTMPPNVPDCVEGPATLFWAYDRTKKVTLKKKVAFRDLCRLVVKGGPDLYRFAVATKPPGPWLNFDFLLDLTGNPPKE